MVFSRMLGVRAGIRGGQYGGLPEFLWPFPYATSVSKSMIALPSPFSYKRGILDTRMAWPCRTLSVKGCPPVLCSCIHSATAACRHLINKLQAKVFKENEEALWFFPLLQNLLPDPAEGTRPCGHLDFRPVRLILDF